MKNRLKILEQEAKKNLAKIGISSLSFFKFDYGNEGGGDQTNYIGFENSVFKWVFYERGRPYIEGQYESETELLQFIIIKEVERFVREFYRDEIDSVYGSNRKLFRKQIELLQEINQEWAEQRRFQIVEILRKQPYDDHIQVRWDYRNKLQAEGKTYREADKMSYLKYPKVKPEANPEI